MVIRILVHQSLLDCVQLSEIKQNPDYTLHLLPVLHWADISKEIHDPRCIALVLPIKTQNIDGILCCKQIKERPAFSTKRIVLVASSKDVNFENDIATSGADAFVKLPDEIDQVDAFLENLILLTQEAPKRSSKRISTQGSVSFVLGEEQCEGVLLNISLSGVLIASHKKIPEGTLTALTISEENEPLITKEARFVREVEHSNKDFPYVAAFEFVSEPLKNQDIEKLKESASKNKFSFPVIQEVFKATLESIEDNTLPPEAKLFLWQEPNEKKVMDSSPELSNMILKMMLAETQCKMLSLFLIENEDIQKNVLMQSIVYVSDCLGDIVDCESAMEELFSNYITQGNTEELRVLKNRAKMLNESKVKLLFAAHENIPKKNISGDHLKMLQMIEEQVSVIRQYQVKITPAQPIVHKPTPQPTHIPAPDNVKTDAKETHTKTQKLSLLKNTYFQIGVAVLFSIAMIWNFKSYLWTPRVDVKKINFPIQIVKSSVIDNGIVLTIDREHWNALLESQKKIASENLVEFLKSENLEYASFNDLRNDEMMHLASSIVNGKREYQSMLQSNPLP